MAQPAHARPRAWRSQSTRGQRCQRLTCRQYSREAKVISCYAANVAAACAANAACKGNAVCSANEASKTSLLMLKVSLANAVQSKSTQLSEVSDTSGRQPRQLGAAAQLSSLMVSLQPMPSWRLRPANHTCLSKSVHAARRSLSVW
jgi:hypothetical protein